MSILIYAFQSDIDKVRRIDLPATASINRRVDQHATDVIVRWGKSNLGTDGAGRECDFLHTLNPAAAIRRNTQKHKALAALSKVVNTPRIWVKRVPIKKTVIVRPISHSGGRDFAVVKGPCRVPRGFYATEYISTPHEHRVWFVRSGPNQGFTMHAKRVKLKNDIEGIYPCRSQWGYQFREKVPHALHLLVLKAATRMGLDCGAADVLFKGGRWYALELNTAPSVDAKRIRLFYTEHLKEAIKTRFPKLVLEDRSMVAPSALPSLFGGPAHVPVGGVSLASASTTAASKPKVSKPKSTSTLTKVVQTAKSMAAGVGRAVTGVPGKGARR